MLILIMPFLYSSMDGLSWALILVLELDGTQPFTRPQSGLVSDPHPCVGRVIVQVLGHKLNEYNQFLFRRYIPASREFTRLDLSFYTEYFWTK